MVLFGEETPFNGIKFSTRLDIDSVTNMVKYIQADSDTVTIKNPSVPDDIVNDGKLILNGNMVFQQLSGQIQLSTNTNVDW